MTTVERITGLEEFTKLWPHLADNAPSTVPAEELLHMSLSCLSHGVIFVCRDFGQLIGLCCVLRDGEEATLVSIPRERGGKYGQRCLAAVKDWARLVGVKSISVTSTRLSGSSYKYFEKALGFHRHSVTFKKEL